MSRTVDGVPAELEALTARLLAKDPRDRLGFAADVAAELVRLGAIGGFEGYPPQDYLYQPGLAGRESTMKMLEAKVEQLQDRRGGLVFIGGESGMGKTRLAMEVARMAFPQGVTVFTGECREHLRTPLAPLRDLLRGIADRCREGGDRATERLLGPRGAVLAAYEPSIGRLPLVAAQRPPADLPAPAARARLHTYLAATLTVLAQDGPLLLLLDDLQWADELSLGFLGHVIKGHRLAKLPVMVVATYRQEEAGPELLELTQAPQTTWVRLDTLDGEGIATMVSDMLALRPPPEVLSKYLTRQSGGNPFFVAEYLRAALQEGLLWRDEAGDWQVAGPSREDATEQDYAALPLPRGLADLVSRRLAALSPQARRVAEAASVLGSEGPVETLQKVGELSTDDLFEGLGELLQRHVLHETDTGGVAFVHDQLRQTTHDAIETTRRRKLHHAAARERSKEEDPSPAELARHWEEAGDLEQARARYLEAARRAAHTHALDEAERLYRCVLSIAPEPSLDAVRARNELGQSVLQMQGRTDEAKREHQMAAGQARELGARAAEAESLGALGHAYWRTGDMTMSTDLFLQALGIFREVGDRYREGVSLSNLALPHKDRGDLAAARDFQEQALAIARELEDPRLEGSVTMNLAEMEQTLGQLDEAQRHYELALELYRRADNRGSEGLVLFNLASLHHLRGELGAARPLYDEALTIQLEVGDRRVEGAILGNLAELCQAQGKLQEARELYEQALQTHREVGERRFEGWSLGCLGDLGRFTREDLEESEALLIAGERLSTETGDRNEMGLHAGRRGLMALAREAEDAVVDDHLARARSIAEQLGVAPESELGRLVALLTRARDARRGGVELLCGQCPEDVPPGVRTWMESHAPGRDR